MMAPGQEILNAWKLLEAQWSEQFWCITSVSWEAPNTLIVTLNWDVSGQVRMVVAEDGESFILGPIRKGKKRYRKPGEYGPI